VTPSNVWMMAMFRRSNPAVEWAGNAAGLRAAWRGFDDDEKREIIKDAFGSVTISRATRRGSGFDPTRVELGMNIAVGAEIERQAAQGPTAILDEYRYS
jgi:hypothetical protein